MWDKIHVDYLRITVVQLFRPVRLYVSPQTGHCISEVILPSHPLTPSSPSAFDPSQNQDLFQYESLDSHFGHFPGNSAEKNPPATVGVKGLTPGLRRSPEGNDNPLQCSCLENPMYRADFPAIVHGTAEELNMTE